MQENYLPNRREQFLWWLSTAETALVKDAVVDRNRHSIVGMLVLGTWSFATLAWAYFFSTVVSAWWIALVLGIFMGFGVTAIVKGKFFIPWAWITLGLVVCIVVGIVSGLYPALKASKLDPIESLRYE